MKQALKKVEATCFHFVDGEKITGAPSGLSGNVNDCELTDAERAAGVEVATLVSQS